MKRRGKGVACLWYGIARTATIDAAGAHVEIDDGGTVKVLTGVTEIGEGILTVLAQVAAEECGVRPEDVTIGDNDTARSPEAAHAGATRQTYMVGNAVALACRDARRKLDAELAAYWGVPAEDIDARNGEVWSRSDPAKRLPLREAVRICKKRGTIPVGSGSFASRGTPLDPETGAAEPWQAYVFGTQIAEVEVDTGTGEVRVLNVWAAHDVGRAINPQGAEGQIEGGVVMGIGYGLMEEYVLVDGASRSLGFSKYILPSALDIPRIHSIIIQEPDPLSPLGAKGIGEPALLAAAPAIINAIHDACGIWIDTLPASPERVLAALREKEAAEQALRR